MTDDTNRLDPGEIATRLMLLRPDRDQRASQICAETLLTLVSNRYQAPDAEPLSPKVQRFGLRSLVFGQNFLQGYTDTLPGTDIRADDYGARLAISEDFQGAENLHLARSALRSLLDPSTERGAQEGQRLLMPFHESLLWFDARKAGARYTARKVLMRGAGVTLARILLKPPGSCSNDVKELARRAVCGIREALTHDSPLSKVAHELERVLPESLRHPPELQGDERDSWALPDIKDMEAFSSSLIRHVEGISQQSGASGPAKLWQLRLMLGLDMSIDMLRRSWVRNETPLQERKLLLALPGFSRQSDRVRLRSERSFNVARRAIHWATVRTLATVLEAIHCEEQQGIDWGNELDQRTFRRLGAVIRSNYNATGANDFLKLAQRVFETADYKRAGEGFRVLLETIGMSAGGTRYRYLSATPDLMSALVGALSAEMPMSSDDFFIRVASEWDLVISPNSATGATLAADVDGPDMAMNARRFEQLLIECGLASGLSDRTVLVGERAGRRRR